MDIDTALDESESMAELLKKFVRPIASDGQSTALRRALRTEGANDGVPARSQCLQYLLHILAALALIGEEMEDGAVMPDVDGLRREVMLQHVCQHPIYLARAIAPPLTSHLQRLGRDVQPCRLALCG